MQKEINIDFINEMLKFICGSLNDSKINYYLAGSIGAYIDARIPLEQIHEDIDIMIEEKNIYKLERIFKNTDFVLYDKRLTSNKVLNDLGYTDGSHEVFAQYKYNDFHIGFFLLRFNDSSYSTIEYFRKNGIQKKLERTLPIEYFEAQYNDELIDYMGIKLKTTRKETIYKNKTVMNREKDLFDIEKLKPTIENKKIEKLKGLSKYRRTTIIDL